MADNCSPVTAGHASAAPADSIEPCDSAKAARSPLAGFLPIGLIILATLAVYTPVLFNYFNGDDFVHLTWLADAVKNPELIWRNFHSSWLDGTTTRFYRPLISVFMVSDYLAWGTNGLGFHITNLLFHTGSVVLLFLITRSLTDKLSASNPSPIAWPLAAAILFGLYPLHPEAVSWITGRVDSIVTFFCLSSFWCYMQWRTKNSATLLLACAGTMILALLSKEMAVTLPPLFMAYELCFGKFHSFGSFIKSLLYPTAIFWLLLAAYFVVRRLALGTFVGGYDDSLLFIANWKLFVSGWAHGLRMLLVPINKELLGAHSPLTKLWELTLVLSAALIIERLAGDKRLLKPFTFLLIWFALSLVPVYKIFAIADDLEGSRLAYLATAPLCALLTIFTAGSPGKTGKKFLLPGALAVIFALNSAALLSVNNQVWVAAGQESNRIRRQLNSLYSSIKGDPQVLFIGLPDNIKGAYVCRNALFGMTHAPQMSRSVTNCLPVGQFEPILPFGYLKQSIVENQDKIKIFRWDNSSGTFLPVLLAPTAGQMAERFSGQQLSKAISEIPGGAAEYRWLPDGSLEATGKSGAKGRPRLRINLANRPCWSTDFIAITVSGTNQHAGPRAEAESSGAVDLLYCNSLNPKRDLRRRLHAVIPENGGTIYFALRGLPEWALGGLCGELELLLPEDCRTRVEAVAVMPPHAVMPDLTFANSGFLGSKGFLHLSRQESSGKVFADATKVPGAARLALEVTRASLTFENQNCAEETSVLMQRLALGTTSGTITLKRDDFPSAGIYEARLRALDKYGKTAGVAGDHIVIAVDN